MAGICLSCLSVFAGPARPARGAGWPANPSVNVAVSDTAGTQEEFRFVADGQGGVYVLWADYGAGGTSPLIKLKRFGPNGSSAGWPAQGMVLAENSWAVGEMNVIGVDGGVIVSWLPDQSDGLLRVQNVDSTGVLRWGSGAVQATLTAISEMDNAAVRLSDGSVVYAWWNSGVPNPNSKIRLMRVLPTGTRGWSQEVVARDLPTTVEQPSIAAVSDTEVVVTWLDRRDNGIYGQRVGASGVTQWQQNGLKLLPRGYWGEIASNGLGGLCGVYVDFASDPNFGDLLLFNVGPDGAPFGGWPAAGVPYATAPGVITSTGRVVASPADSSVLLAWGYRANNANGDYQVQKFDQNAQPLWPGVGKLAYHGVSSTRGYDSAPDGVGGMFLSIFRPSTNNDLYLQHILPDGSVAWQDGGVPVSTAAGTQYASTWTLRTSTPDSSGGAFVCWRDTRNAATSPDLYIQHVNADGTLGGVVTATEASAISATYLGGCAEVRWHASVDPGVTFAAQRQQDGGEWTTIGAPADEGDDLWAARDCAVVRGARYAYRLEWTQDGSVRHSSAISLAIPLQPEFAMSPPWPNPVRNRVTFDYALSRRGPVRVSVHDLSGRLVKVIESGERDAGEHRVVWHAEAAAGRALDPGCYWIQLEAEGQRRSRQVVVVR